MNNQVTPDHFSIIKVDLTERNEIKRIKLKLDYAHHIAFMKGKPKKCVKHPCICLYREGNPENIFAFVVHNEVDSETLNVSELARLHGVEKWLKEIKWYRNKIQSQLENFILSQCQSNIVKSNTINEIQNNKHKSLAQSGINPKDKFYKVNIEGGSVDFKVIDIPYYYLCGFRKKMDISENSSDPFSTLASKTIEEGRTFLRHDRLYTLWQSLRNVKHLESPIIEIGVCRGGSLKFLLEAQKWFGKSGKLYGVDTFSGHAFVQDGSDGKHAVGGFSDLTNYDDVSHYFSENRDTVILKKGPIEEVYDSIHEKSFSLVHIDVDVYPSIKFCLENFSNQLEPNGIIIVDDYGNNDCPGVYKAVEEFMQDRKGFYHMHLLTGQALIMKRSFS